MAGKSNLDNIFLKSIRKQIKQDQLDNKIFLGLLNQFTESIYKPKDRTLIADAIRLILDGGKLKDGSIDMAAAIILNGLKKTNEKDFLIFVRAFQILFKFAGSLVIGGGREEVMQFAHELQKKVDYKLLVVGELPEISTQIGVNTNGREIIIQKAGTS